jgi:hypothetical protein
MAEKTLNPNPPIDSVRDVARFASATSFWDQWDVKADGYSDQLEGVTSFLDLFIRQGLEVLEGVHRSDTAFRLRLFENKAEIAEESIILDQYRGWLNSARLVLKHLDRVERDGGRIESAPRFRKAVQEIEGVLTDDADFFAGEPLEQLGRSALDEHRSGVCEQFPE